jgi:hypothetical protein
VFFPALQFDAITNSFNSLNAVEYTRSFTSEALFVRLKYIFNCVLFAGLIGFGAVERLVITCLSASVAAGVAVAVKVGVSV